MSKEQDIRWEQRLTNYNKALAKLDQAVQRIKAEYYSAGKFDDELLEAGDDIIIEGLIQRFEYTHELAWNVMKDFLKNRGTTEIYGSKDATREAYSTGLIADGQTWMSMIGSRNKTSHTYNEETANDIFLKILESYHTAFLEFQRIMEAKRSNG